MKESKNTRTILTVYPYDCEILEETDEKGNVHYLHPRTGVKIDVFSESMEYYLEILLGRFKVLDSVIETSGDPADISCLFNALLEQTTSRIYELFRFIEASVGEIDCTMVGYNESLYRPERVLGVSVTPKEECHE